MTAEGWTGLVCHVSSHPESVRAIQVMVRRAANAELKMTFRVDGDISQIRLSPPGAPGIGTELWRHTCFEAFIATETRPAYHEFNFAPSGKWAVYAFSGYRNGGSPGDEATNPHIAVRSTAGRFELDALVRLDLLSALHVRAPLRMGLCAIIETNDGLSYWALRHPIDKPDFHDANGFAMLLEPPDRK